MRLKSPFFQKCALFRHLDSQELAAIQQTFPWSSVSLAKNAIFGLPGDELTHFRAVEQGSLAAELSDERGTVMLIETLDAGATIAGPLLFSSQPILPVQLRALEDTSVTSMPKSAFMKLLAAHPKVMAALLTESADKVAFLAEKIRLLQFATLEQKLIHWFKRQVKLQNPQATAQTQPLLVRFPYTQETLASLFGVTRPALSRSLGEMVNQGAITRVARGSYLVHHLIGDTEIG